MFPGTCLNPKAGESTACADAKAIISEEGKYGSYQIF